MKKMIKALGLAVALFAGSANAALILNITDEGGQARFTFEGSDVILADGSLNNGIWLASDEISGLFNLTDYAARTRSAAISGLGSTTVDGATNTFQDTWWNGTESYNTLGIRFGNSVFGSAGEVISWTGSVLTQLSFDHFNAGSFLATRIGPTQGELATLTQGITINVGPVTAIPAPTPLALLGLGLMLVAFNRRKAA